MTREESTAKLVQLRAEAKELAKKYNSLLTENKIAASVKVDAEITEKVNEYTSIVRTMCFEECKATDDPMKAAVTMLFYKTIGVKDEKKGDDQVPIRYIVDKERQIDLLKLDKYCGGIGHDKNWAHIAQKMNFLLTVQKCKDLGIDPKAVNDSYSMTEIAREFNMGKNPVSKTNLLKTLQTVITAMLGDGYKATSHDVNFLMSVYAKKSRQALTVVAANHRYFRNYLAEICNRIVTGASYQVEFRTKKQTEQTAQGGSKDATAAETEDSAA